MQFTFNMSAYQMQQNKSNASTLIIQPMRHAAAVTDINQLKFVAYLDRIECTQVSQCPPLVPMVTEVISKAINYFLPFFSCPFFTSGRPIGCWTSFAWQVDVTELWAVLVVLVAVNKTNIVVVLSTTTTTTTTMLNSKKPFDDAESNYKRAVP